MRAARSGKPRATRGDQASREDAVEAALAAFAHDVRTPLTGILALSELLATSDLGDRERLWVASLKSAAEHLAALATVVVDGVRAEAAQLPVRAEPFGLRRLAAACAASVAARAQAKGLACDSEIADGLPERVAGDAVRLRSLIENVAENAVKFTERGTIGFKVSAAPARGKKLRLRFEISDTGIGITPAETRRLFKPFSQANDAIGRRFGGAGLGLSLVRRLARAMGGGLSVTSAPGRGSVFTLEVVVAAAPADSATAAENAAGAAPPLRLLCVEDNPYARVVMNTILTELGHAVDFAQTGEAACEAVARARYDAVLMDLALSGIDGFEATRRIRALSGEAARVPVIAISGHGDGASERKALDAGLDGFLAKPVSPAALTALLARVTQR